MDLMIPHDKVCNGVLPDTKTTAPDNALLNVNLINAKALRRKGTKNRTLSADGFNMAHAGRTMYPHRL